MRYASIFIVLMLSALSFHSVFYQPGGGPEDDPVHGMFKPNPGTDCYLKNRDRWRAEIEATRGLHYLERPEWAKFEQASKLEELPTELKAWIRTYNEWQDERAQADREAFLEQLK